MSSAIFLGLALSLLGAGFVILATAVRNWLNPETQARLARHSLKIGIAVLLLAVGSGISFWWYTVSSQKQGQASRLQVYEQFSELPRIERLASAGLGQMIHNDDEVSADGTTWLTVALSPSGTFSAQFSPWGPKDKLWLKMRITAPGFDVSPVLDETKQVPGDVMTFAWILRARETGDQVVNVSGVAFRQTAAGIVYDRATVVNAMRSIWVKPSFPIEAWTPVVTALIGLLGTGALPLLLQRRGAAMKDPISSSRSAPNP